jgi:protein-L-isoaspartate(D-aspartate) O-methyltransferase
MKQATDRSAEREAMVTCQLARRGVVDARVLEAMRCVPREAFVDDACRADAYDDSPLPIGAGQTISQPYVVARMLELAQLAPSDRVLEVGAGSGYATAVISRIAARVYGVERQGALVGAAQRALADLGYHNASIIHGDGLRGLAQAAPFDAIIVSAGGELPEALTSQLAIGGRLVIPLDVNGYQMLTRVIRLAEDEFETTQHEAVRFVPLLPDVEGPLTPPSPAR